MGRNDRDRKRSRSRSRERRRSRSRSRERGKDKKKEHKKEEKTRKLEKSAPPAAAAAAATTTLDAEEQKKLERQAAWQKAKLAMLREAAEPEEKKNSSIATTATTTTTTSSSSSSAPVATLGALASAQQPVMKNLFADEDDAVVHKVADPSKIVFGSALPLSSMAADDDEEEDVKDKPASASAAATATPAGDEPDELDMFMTGVQAEHEKLLKEDRKGVKVAGEVGDEQGDDEEAMQMFGSDDERFLAGTVAKGKTLEAFDHSSFTYAPFNKNFYIETETIRRMTDKEVKKLRKKLDHIRVRGKDCPKPITRFTEAGLSDAVLKILEKANFHTPTPIQAQALPAIMSGRDVIGIAKTGSGKTLAYLLPMLRHIADQPPLAERDGPIGLILVPTRELCLQITQELKRFKNTLSVVAVYGGSDVSCQIGNLKRGAEVVVATPGRLIDILTLNSGKITNLRRVTYLVLDEADRMFDMGFAPQITRLIDNVRPNKQAVMFSATFPTSVETLARKALKNPVEIVVGGRLQVCGDVDQKIEVCRDDMRFPLLLQALGEWSSKGQILIFCDRQEAVDQLYRKLLDQGYTSLTLHGGKDQLDRISVISDFKSGLENILIATSVAARGLDVRNLVLVVNYDVPNHIEDYVHRVGRTGRAGRKGTAITFLTPEQDRYAAALAKALVESGKPVPPKLAELVNEYRKKVETGAVIDHKMDGFKTTKGFKFTDEEAKEKRRMEMATYGIDLGSSSSESEEGEGEEGGGGEDEEGVVTIGGVRKHVDALSQDELIQMIDEQEIQRIEALGEKVDLTVEEAARQQVLRAEAAVGGGLKVRKRVLKPLRALLTSTHQRAADLARVLAQKAAAGQAAPAADEDDFNTKFQAEIPINEFPQQVRFKVSNKETIDSIIEMFPGVAITVKGTYTPPGRKPIGAERKLYIELVGYNELNVRLCKREIIRIMKETAAAQVGIGGGRERYSKYQVV